jgi:methanogenic corrinoid protein MtbC1
MQQDIAIERLFQSLIAGDRIGARQLVSEYLASGHRSEDLAIDVLWPSMQTLFQMWRNDQLSTLAHRYATRMMRTIVDQAQASYAQAPRNGRRVILACGADETEDMAAQLAADFLEAAGYEVLFAASGVANDELLAETGTRRPDALIMFAAGASDAPRIRQLIDTIHAIRATPGMPIICSAGGDWQQGSRVPHRRAHRGAHRAPCARCSGLIGQTSWCSAASSRECHVGAQRCCIAVAP